VPSSPDFFFPPSSTANFLPSPHSHSEPYAVPTVLFLITCPLAPCVSFVLRTILSVFLWFIRLDYRFPRVTFFLLKVISKFSFLRIFLFLFLFFLFSFILPNWGKLCPGTQVNPLFRFSRNQGFSSQHHPSFLAPFESLQKFACFVIFLSLPFELWFQTGQDKQGDVP